MNGRTFAGTRPGNTVRGPKFDVTANIAELGDERSETLNAVTRNVDLPKLPVLDQRGVLVVLNIAQPRADRKSESNQYCYKNQEDNERRK